MTSISRKKSRKGVGYMGKVFQYGTGWDGKNGYATSRDYKGRDEKIQKLNKHPAMKRATKKAVNRYLDKVHND